MFSGSAARAEITELRIKSSLEKNLRQKLPFWSQMGYGLCIGYVLPYFDGTFPTRSQVWKSSLIWYIIVGISFKLALEKPEEQTAYYPRHKSAKRTSWSVEEIMFLLAATIAALRAAYCCSKTIFFIDSVQKWGIPKFFGLFLENQIVSAIKMPVARTWPGLGWPFPARPIERYSRNRRSPWPFPRVPRYLSLVIFI